MKKIIIFLAVMLISYSAISQQLTNTFRGSLWNAEGYLGADSGFVFNDTAQINYNPNKPTLQYDSVSNKLHFFSDSTWKKLSFENFVGSDSLSGDGSANIFTVNHDSTYIPGKIIITPTSADAAKAQFYVDKSQTTDNSFIIIAAGVAPPSGTDNVSLDYELIK